MIPLEPFSFIALLIIDVIVPLFCANISENPVASKVVIEKFTLTPPPVPLAFCCICPGELGTNNSQ